jgi:hypothetical protein
MFRVFIYERTVVFVCIRRRCVCIISASLTEKLGVHRTGEHWSFTTPMSFILFHQKTSCVCVVNAAIRPNRPSRTLRRRRLSYSQFIMLDERARQNVCQKEQ